ncbi:brain protein I3-like protein [Dinothrombium tinctorium]|uniref:Membrane protein BRI3 n=1 Tax=Dinothrombium tinctorium TaxID=1965070 RepID=A0A3S3PKN0_9ACAR|nr:brain protein I3-like protein [Dinothrombium tinctorium]
MSEPSASVPVYDRPPPYTPYPTPQYNADCKQYPVQYPPPPANTQGFANPNWNSTQFPNYGSTTVIIQPEPVPQVIVVGNCPVCRVGVLEEDFTCLGVLLALICFPLGILCCLALRQRRCPNCGATFE